MSAVNAETRVEWSTRLAQALVQGGYETEANLAPLLAEARATGQTLAELLISRNLALPGVVVGALAHLAQLPAIDLTAMTPSPDAVGGHARGCCLEFKAVAAAVRRKCPGRGICRASVELTTSTRWPPVSDTGSIRYWPIRY